MSYSEQLMTNLNAKTGKNQAIKCGTNTNSGCEGHEEPLRQET
eukprot:CAMPEP_0113725398 /NCGR_PEP_ID=MMETSP0038_2-20120614/39720_1 /TAXON_ID=2898 /ORGANISM="Cryptomonas paramecium" /LENGTH=42 /DNA_ID=CAMNT_0000655621 /DNA_START=47 /DNA_END=171 /DNA_ORIENTATION=+ /assembly_acc=CAM_ASM_000170